MANDEALPQEIFFRLSGAGDSTWETHQPQSIIIKLVEQGIFNGEILDIGCGIADNAIYIANHAKDVRITAVDFVPKAIEVAREKAKTANANVQFEVVDFLKDLSNTNLKKHSYDIALDAAVFHGFSNEQRQIYLKNLEYLIKPDGLFILVCYSEKETRKTGPRRIKTSDLHELFSAQNGWNIQSIEDVIYDSRPDSLLAGGVQAFLVLIRRKNL